MKPLIYSSQKLKGGLFTSRWYRGFIFRKTPQIPNRGFIFRKIFARASRGVLFVCIFASFLTRKSPKYPIFSAALRAGSYFSQILHDSRHGFIWRKSQT